MNSQTILITGGLGQVGSYLTDRFCTDNKVIVLDNTSSPCRHDVPAGVQLVVGDIQGPEAVRLVEQADVVIHTAAQIDVNRSLDQPLFDCENNILGTLNLLEAARRTSLKRFVYFSSAAIYGDTIYTPIDENHPTQPLSPYGVSKLTGEQYALMYHRAFDLPVAVLRPFNIYSPRQDPSNPYSGVITKFIERSKAQQSPIIFGDGEQTRDFISVHDIVNLVQLLIEKDEAIGKVFNAGTGTQTSVNRLAEIVQDVFDSDLPVEYQKARTGDIRHSVADISAAEGLGFAPKVSLEDGLAEFVAKM
ncbi:NAD-dependent epimerase/dehydratase family protein [Methanohalophilus halophilus]|uniref:Epimerase n=1 Tax=Methanohalophilus halophilus TaxID=2177 RepID=A0A1L3Q109_9EURY|nr:NAD-dependent epimerase/dehydratase family protein [Methanohalophilus halophilus]APH38556.1 epimerase [Methanohalophilus halophilus]RNI08450.1 NAD-dependent epimerase/dehydratase family protein [Methanohalophilus halophilus]SDW14275.1 UDP-glucose 4-epimerase [Methanohalophilus halophilus]